MKVVIGLIALYLVGCSEAISSDTEKPASCECEKHHCETKLVGPVWKPGTLCAKGEVSQGHGKNPQGVEVTGCYKLETTCKPE